MIEPISCGNKPIRFTGQGAVVVKETGSSMQAMPDSSMRNQYAAQIKQIETKRGEYTIKPEHYQQFALNQNPYAKAPQPGQFVDEIR